MRATDWLMAAGNQCNNFRCCSAHMQQNNNKGFPATKPSTIHGCVKTAVDDFKKGIKKDPKAFNKLKDQKLFDKWHCHAVAQAKAQDVGDALNKTHKPMT